MKKKIGSNKSYIQSLFEKIKQQKQVFTTTRRRRRHKKWNKNARIKMLLHANSSRFDD